MYVNFNVLSGVGTYNTIRSILNLENIFEIKDVYTNLVLITYTEL